MLVRPYLLLYRKRLIAAAVVSLAVPLLLLFVTTADSITDFGVLWHHVCSCPLNLRDASSLIEGFEFTSLALPLILGMSAGFAGARTPGLQGDTLFLLTRPTPRRSLIIEPLIIAAGAIAILPSLGWLLLLGWLRIVQAPSLGHLVALAEMVPSASSLGPHPSFLALMSALHLGRRFLAAFSVGLSIYVFFAAQRWLLLSSNPRLRLLGSLQLFVIFLPSWHFISRRVVMLIMLWVPRGGNLTYMPSDSGIALHFTFAAAVLYGSWQLLRRIEV